EVPQGALQAARVVEPIEHHDLATGLIGGRQCARRQFLAHLHQELTGEEVGGQSVGELLDGAPPGGRMRHGNGEGSQTEAPDYREGGSPTSAHRAWLPREVPPAGAGPPDPRSRPAAPWPQRPRSAPARPEGPGPERTRPARS